MSDVGDGKFKWTPESTSLLVSVWSDNQVQKQLEYATKPELIWESIARYMNKKGYNVTAKQCRSRMKRVLVCYHEAKRATTRGNVEQYYESIDRVLLSKKNNDIYATDTVDSAVDPKSPPKDVKTNKNLQMRHKLQEPANCIYRTNALTPTWIVERDQEYPDSPESNETVLAQPYRVFSPVRDAATNTRHQLTDLTSKMKRNILAEEAPMKETIQQNQTHLHNYLNEVPLQNAVQNVQNQIIQENMQQNQVLLQQTLLQKRLLEQNVMNSGFQQQCRNLNQMNYVNLARQNVEIPQAQIPITAHNVYADNPIRFQNQYQQNSMRNCNQAVPQEPRRSAFTQNVGPRQNYVDFNLIESISPSYSPDNLNDAFCQTNTTENNHNLNETYNQPTTTNRAINLPNIDNTMITNNATFNDDTISIEFLQDSSSVSDNERPKSKDCSVNTDIDVVPSVPFRKKKQQKMEQLMLNAINSQNDVVNKILSAQSDMVNRFLDVDRDRQNRLEHRLDNLLDVVKATVLNKSHEKDNDHSSNCGGEAVITNLQPPPRPGTLPPKLDLVAPKPCRVPCTVINSNVELINQNPVNTRPGVVSPILSPSRKPGAIWAKLGPVSTSPFVRAQQQLGLTIPPNAEERTKSSAERRIAKQVETIMDVKSLIFETMAFIEMEKQVLEKVENAQLEKALNNDNNQVRRKLFELKEPTVAMELTAAFLEIERQSQQIFESARIAFENNRVSQLKKDFLKAINTHTLQDKVLRGQGESYDKIKQMEMQNNFVESPCDTSTPAKYNQPIMNKQENVEPRQTIQQLAQRLMNSARWRDAASARRPPPPFLFDNFQQSEKQTNMNNKMPVCKTDLNYANIDSNAKTLNWIQDRHSYPSQMSTNALPLQHNRHSYNPPIAGIEPLGFIAEKLTDSEPEDMKRDYAKYIGFVDEKALPFKKLDRENNDHVEQLKQLYLQYQMRQQQTKDNLFMAQQTDLIKQYAKDMGIIKGGRASESDTDEEFLDTTATMHPRKGSITSGTSSKASKTDKCVIS